MAVIDDFTDGVVLPSREVWERARKVLCGEDERGCTKRLVIRETGCHLSMIESWVARSREQRPTDEAWVWEIAQLWDAMDRTQAVLLEGALMANAITDRVKVRESFDAEGKPLGKTVITEKGGSESAQKRALEALNPRRWAPQKAGGGRAGGRVFEPEEAKKRVEANIRLKKLIAERGNPGRADYCDDIQAGMPSAVSAPGGVRVVQGELVDEVDFDEEI